MPELGTDDIPWPAPGGGLEYIRTIEATSNVSITLERQEGGLCEYTLTRPGSSLENYITINEVSPGKRRVTWTGDRSSGSFITPDPLETCLKKAVQKIMAGPTAWASGPRLI